MGPILLALVALATAWAPHRSHQAARFAGSAGADSFLARGRFWHALEAAPRLPRAPRPVPLELALLHARIAEGLGRWDQVDQVLRRVRGGDSLPGYLALAARVDERTNRWAAAEAKYRALAALPAAPPAMRATALVRRAEVLEALGRADSAVAAWRRASQTLPEIADWFAIHRAEFERDTALAFAAVSGARSPGASQRADAFVARRRLAAGNLRGALEAFRRLGRPLDVARVEFALGQRRVARRRADSLLFADPTKPAGLLAATFLTERFDSLSVRELAAISRAYRARDDLASAERYLRRGLARADTSVALWLELAGLESERDDVSAALAAVDSAGAHAGRRRVTLVAGARIAALTAAGRWEEADTQLARLVRAHPGDSNIAQAVMRLAAHDRALYRTGLELQRYRLLLRRFPNAPATNVARFRLGLAAYAGGEPDTAAAIVAAVLARDTANQLGSGPRYWDARLKFERGDSAALRALAAIAADDPTNFHGVRAREMLGDTLSFLLDTVLALPRPGSFPPARARERIRLLASLGFETEARAEASGWASDTSASAHLLIAAAAAAAEAGFAREAILLGEAARRRAGMVPGVARALFPLPYRDVIEAEAVEHGVDPMLMAAIIRQESRFDPRALSRAGARGMSQVLPRTGAEMARYMGIRPWDPDLLYVPDFNLHFGARYLYERTAVDSFPVYAALASYNAGRVRVDRWRRWPEFGDPDLFAERVAINETRNYVKVVYASYVWYRQAYRSMPDRERDRSGQ